MSKFIMLSYFSSLICLLGAVVSLGFTALLDREPPGTPCLVFGGIGVLSGLCMFVLIIFDVVTGPGVG